MQEIVLSRATLWVRGEGDPGCQSPDSALEDPRCDDGFDNDADGGVDCDGGPSGAVPDAQCVHPWRDREKSTGGCGLGAELATLLCLLRRRRASSA